MKRKRILILDNFEQDSIELRKTLIAAGYEVRIVQEAKAIDNYFDELLPDLLIVETRLADLNLTQLVEAVRAKADKKIVPIVATGNPRTVEERIIILDQKVDDFIYKPNDLDEVLVRLENLIKEAAEVTETPSSTSKGFSGSLSEMSLVDLLQTLEVGKKTGTITLHKEGREGTVFIIDGDVVDVELADLEPKQALMRMFTWLEGQFSVEMKKHETTKRLFVTTREIISEGMTLQFRWDQLTKQLPNLRTVISASNNGYQNSLSEDEKQVYKQLNGNKSYIEVIEESAFDDIKALRLIKSLYEKGFVEENDTESTQFFNPEHKLKLSTEPTNGSGSSNLLARAFSGMLLSPESEAKAGHNNRRMDRRQVDRRRTDRRKDVEVGENKIWLNKTELIMIREKLLSGIKKQI